MARILLFEALDYKAYLIKALEFRSLTIKGQRSKLARQMDCHPAYLTSVLNGDKNLSLEQAHAASAFLGHNASEAKFFLNLVSLARAGTRELRLYFEEELQRLRADSLMIKNRIKAHQTLNQEQQARYYSAWYFTAIHVAVSLANLRSKDRLCQALQLPMHTVSEVLEFLTEIAVLKFNGEEFEQGATQLHVDANSPSLSKHHSNWRVRAIQAFDNKSPLSLHYSSVVTCSLDDVAVVRETLIFAIQSIRDTIRESKDETIYAYCLDLFPVLGSAFNGKVEGK